LSGAGPGRAEAETLLGPSLDERRFGCSPARTARLSPVECCFRRSGHGRRNRWKDGADSIGAS